MCGEHPKTWSWDKEALSCGARRSDRAALQVPLLSSALWISNKNPTMWQVPHLLQTKHMT